MIYIGWMEFFFFEKEIIVFVLDVGVVIVCNDIKVWNINIIRYNDFNF